MRKFFAAVLLVPAAAAAAEDASPPPALEEVVVTAERRTTNLQTTGISASVLSGADLANKGIMTVDGLQAIAPSVVIENFGQGNNFNIRGIGKGEHNTQTSTGVITYRDGVPTFPGYFQDEPYYDISNVEILRGPQGTFVGQNATGGAVFITETNPSFEGVHGYVSGQYGNYNDALLQGAVNLPISDTLATRLAFNTERRDSFYTYVGGYNGNHGELKEGSFRASFLWKPVDALKVLFKTDYNYVDQGAYPADPATATNDLFHITANAHQLAIDQWVRSVLSADYLFANGVTLRSITGYQSGRTSYGGDLDGTSQPISTFIDSVNEFVWTQEINLISRDSGPFTWIVGASYEHNTYDFPDGRFVIGVPPGVFDILISGVNPEQSVGEFAQLSFNLPAGVQLQLGGRYSQFRTTNRVFESFPELGVTLPDFQTLTENKATGKAAINWTVNHDNFVYAFVSTGVKPGGLNVPSTLTLTEPFRAETVTAYETGWKAAFFNDRLRTQLSAFYNDYKNFQVTVSQPNAPTLSLELNDPSKTEIYGVEAQSQAAFGDLSFDFGVSLLRSRLGSFFASDSRVPRTGLCDPRTGPAGHGCINLSGFEQAYAPKLTLNIGGQYIFHLNPGATLTPRMNFGHIGAQWATLFENTALGDRLGARNLLSAQLAYETGSWTVTGYGANLADQHYVSSIISGLRFAGNPRQYGIRIAKTF